MQASRIVSLSNVNSWRRDEFLSQKRCIHSLIIWLYVDSFSVEGSIYSISKKFRTNSFSSWDLWSFVKICFRFLYNINSVSYILRKLCKIVVISGDLDGAVQFQDWRFRYWNWIGKDYIIYLVHLVYCFRYICNKLFILSNALLWIIYLDYAHPMFPYWVRMLFWWIFIYAMALFHDKSGVCIV